MARLKGIEKLITELKKTEAGLKQGHAADKNSYDQRFLVEGYDGIDLTAIAGSVAARNAIERGYRSIAVGRDVRNKAYLIADAFIKGALSEDMEVIDVGITTTPNCEYVAGHFGIPNAMVTASHMNSAEIGLKINYPRMVERKDMMIIEQLAYEKRSTGGTLRHGGEMATQMLYDRLAKIPNSDGKVKVCIDSTNGVSSIFLKKVLVERGVEVARALRDVPDGNFPTLHNHSPDPTKYQNLEGLSDAVKCSGSEVGFFLDGDGDRTVVVTSDGKALDAAYLAVLFSTHFSAQGNGAYVLDPMLEFIGPVLKRMDIMPEVTKKRGRPYIKAAIFDYKNASDEMVRQVLGGAENSFHFYDNQGLDCGIANVLYMIEICKKGNFDDRLKRIGKEMPFYTPELRVEFKDMGDSEFSRQVEEIVKFSQDHYQVTKDDGYKISDGSSYARIRTSAHEPGVATIVFWNVGNDRIGAEQFFQSVTCNTSKAFYETIMKAYDKEMDVRNNMFVH